MKYTTHCIALITTLTLLGCGFVYAKLPETVVAHWNIHGDANGYMNKFWMVLLFGGIQIGLLVLSVVLPALDPLRGNIAQFKKSYDIFWIGISLFFAYLFGMSMAWNLGHVFNFLYALLPALSFLLFIIGYTIRDAKQNWFFGIRTPWTLASESVWNKTHAVGGRIFMWVAGVPLVGLITHTAKILFFAILLPFLGVALFLVVYSYYVYQKEQSR